MALASTTGKLFYSAALHRLGSRPFFIIIFPFTMTTPSINPRQNEVLAHLRAIGAHINQLLVKYDWEEPMKSHAGILIKHLDSAKKLVRELSA